MTRVVLSMLLAPSFVAAAHAGFPEGKAAYDRGDWAAAWKEFTPLADGGDASAQYYLGQMYARGLGTKADAALAVKWYREAAIAATRRDQVGAALTAAERADAEARIAAWKPKT